MRVIKPKVLPVMSLLPSLGASNTTELVWFIQDASSKDIAVEGGDSHPYGLRAAIRNPWPAIVDDDLNVIGMLLEKASFKFWMSAPVHIG